MNSNQSQGFLRAVLSETRLVDACLLAVVPVGYSLAFIVVFVFVFVTKEQGSTADW